MGFRSHFRDQKEWLDSTNGCMNLNVRCDTAAKEYDAAASQICGWYDDESIGGLEKTISRMIEADGEFVLGRALKHEIELMGALTAPHLNKELKDELDEFNNWVGQKREKGQVNEQELLHCDVVNHWASGELKLAIQKLERLVTLYPEDVIALKIIQDTNFMLGTAMPMRNSLASSLARMSSKNPLKGYVHGMFAFALEESNMYDRAQVEATKALSLIPRDTWAIHNYAHCLEMQAKVEEGLKWMNDKRCDWAPCQTLACHQYWHTALFHINNNQFDDAVALLDNEILTRCKASSSSLDLHDAASMLYRMELVDLFSKTQDPKLKGDSLERWSGVYDMCLPHKRDHLLGFNDAHFMMSFLGKGDSKTAQELRDSISESPDLIVGDSVVRPLLDAMIEFHAKRYSRAVDILEPIRFDIIKIGGSHAQRDVFEQLLLVAALKSDVKEQQKLGERMLVERDTLLGKRVIQTDLLARQAN